MKNLEHKIPYKSSFLEITASSNGYVIYESSYQHHVQINRNTYEVLILINGARTLQEIQFNLRNKDIKISIEVLHELIYDILGKYGIVSTSETLKRTKPDYLKYSITLIPLKMVNHISKILSPLFKIKIFYPVFIISFTILTFTFLTNYSIIYQEFQQLYIFETLLYMLFAGFFLVFHEFGHSTACYNFGVESGSIGFGFYLFTPVMFTDVSKIWKLSIYNRIIVNLGGIYFDIIIAASLILLYFIFSIEQFLLLGCFLTLSSFINLNPFLRYDGYWILSDAIGIPNLKKKSDIILLDTYKKVISKKLRTLSLKDYFLLTYGLVSNFAILVVLFYFLIEDPYSIIKFPSNFIIYSKNIIQGNIDFTVQSLNQFFIPIIFYIIVLKIIIPKIKGLSKNITIY
jgi:putative peptide zinc metalloprotease protein